MSQPLTLQINGKPQSFTGENQPSTVAGLLQKLNLKTDRVAVERNGEIVSRASWSETPIMEGDRFEIVHFVGGGAV